MLFPHPPPCNEMKGKTKRQSLLITTIRPQFLFRIPALQKEKEALSILVVEDNADMRGYIRSILREQYHVLEAANGEEALHILNSNPIDFIISDLMMPVMDGIELSRRVKGNICHFAYSFPDADCQNLTRSPTGKLSYGSGRISAETF